MSGRSNLAPRPNRRTSALLALVFGFTACATPGTRAPTDALGFVVPDLDDAARRESAVFRLETVLSTTQIDPDAFATQRFWASFLLAELHTFAAAEPFLTEPGAARGPASTSRSARPSDTAHLVAAIDHASRARHLFPRVSGKPVPAALGPREMSGVRATLDLLVATGLARLGFRSEVGRLLEDSTALFDPALCTSELERLGVRRELYPWVCVMASEAIRGTNEPDAYRFAVMAIESKERFGVALPEDAVRDLEGWILTEASVQFVCPRSQTAYLPGQRRSPISGVAHFDYVAVPRR